MTTPQTTQRFGRRSFSSIPSDKLQVMEGFVVTVDHITPVEYETLLDDFLSALTVNGHTEELAPHVGLTSAGEGHATIEILQPALEAIEQARSAYGDDKQRTMHQYIIDAIARTLERLQTRAVISGYPVTCIL